MSCFLSYTSSITGDCTNTNSGVFTINIGGTAPDYTIQWLSPPNGTIPLGAGVTAYTQTNLSAGTYTFNIIDSCLSGNTVLPVNIYISSGTCVSITNIINTVCNSNNGSITASTSNLYGQASFYLYNDITGFIVDNTVNNDTYIFNYLASGTYYVIADDGGGCTGKSESVIVKNSSNLSFGLYKVDNAGCAVDSGKLMITGLTGTPPYTYLWSNGGVEDNITGLSDGVYTVTVTDSSNCSVSNTGVINTVPKVGLGAIYLTQPSCFTADGEVEIIITGGTPPFYYLGSNGVTNVTFDRTVTFVGLGPGGFTIQVTDAGLCNFSTSTNLLTPNGMSTINVGITNSKCNDFSGVIGPITVFGGTSPYTYSLTNSLGNTKTNTVYQTNWLFDGLSSDTYNLTITDNGGCTFTSAYTINNEVLFGLTVSTTGTTCNGNNGSVYAQITSGGTPPYIYEINGSIITTSLTSYTFNNLTSGNYTLSVTDVSLCKQSKLFNIGASTTVDFQLLKVDSQNNDGSISVYITNGQPPFTLYWTGDVGGQTGTTVTNLTPGNYSVRVVDNNGCSKTKSITIVGNTNYNSTGYYTVCSSSKFDQPITILSGPKQILNEGYNELILRSDNTNCILTAATFQALVYVGAFSASSVFYTSTGLLDYPSDEEWSNIIQTLLESSSQVGNVSVDLQANTIVITTNCEESSLVNTDVIVKMRIEYDIECACPILTPTPTPTSTPPCIPELIYSGEKFTNLLQSNGSSFKSDGTILYVTGHNNSPLDSVWAYSLSTPWDVSTINLPKIGNSIGFPLGIPSAIYGQYFSPDGLNLFLANSSRNGVFKYTLSTAWDVSTSSYLPGDFVTGATLTGAFYLEFTPDGLFMFVTVSGNLLKKYSLTTPWVISSGVVEIQSIFFGGAFDFTFQNNGYYLFSIIIGGSIRKQTLSIPYDLTPSNILLTETVNVSGFITGNFLSISFKDGYKGFISGYYNSPARSEIYAFNLTCEYDISGIVILPTPGLSPTPTPTPTLTPTLTPTPTITPTPTLP